MLTSPPAVQSDMEKSSPSPRSNIPYISASRLNLWLRCPLAWKLKYADGIVTPSTPSLLVGQVVHAGLEHWYRRRQLGLPVTPEAVVDHVTEIWRSRVATEIVSFKDEAERCQLQTQATNLVLSYLGSIPHDEPLPIGVEANLELPLIDPETGEDLGVRLMGIIDLVLDGPEGLVIVDFKTAASSAAPSPLAHEIQLSIYSYLLRQATGRQEAELQIRSLIKTKVPKVVTHSYPPREPRHFRRLLAVIREYLDCLRHGRFNYRPSWMCGMCDFREPACNNWQA